MNTFELVIIQNDPSPAMGLPLAIWSYVFPSSSERADAILDAIQTTNRFNFAHDKNILISFLKIDSRDAEQVYIEEFAS